MTFKLTLATTTALGLLMSAALAGSNDEVYIDQIGDGNSAAIVQGQTNGSSIGNRAGYTTQRIRQDGANNELVINQTHNSNVNSPPRNQINRVGSPGDQVGLGIDQIGDANYLRIDQTGANQAVFEVQQNGGTSGTTSSNNATITQNGGWSARVSNLRQTFTGAAADASNDVTITQTGQSSRVGNTSSGPRNDGSGAHQTGFGNQLTITQTGNAQLVYTATQTNSASSGGTNVASVTQGGGNGNQIRELSQVNTGAADNTATLTFSGNGNGVTSGVFTGPALGVGLLQSRVRQTGEGNDLSYAAAGDDNLFGFVQDGIGNWIVGTVDGDANQTAISQQGDVNSAQFEIGGASNRFGIAQLGEGNEALAYANGNANELALSQVGLANLGEVRIGSRTPGSSDNVVALNQDSLASFGNVGEIDVDGNANTVSLDQLGLIGSNYGTVDILGNENDVAVGQEGSNESEVGITGNLNVVSLGQNSNASFGNEAGILVGGDGNEVSVDQVGSNVGNVDIQGDQNAVAVGQIGGNQGDLSVTGNGNAAALDQDGDFNSAQVEILGDGNQFDVDQNGDFNDAQALATGNANEVALNQTGDVNSAFVDISGDQNGVAVGQDGDVNTAQAEVLGNNNQIVIDQSGSSNDALALATGNDNEALIDQIGSLNTVSMTFQGDANGSGTLTGAAGSLVSTSGGQLMAGTALQDSSSALSGNSLTYGVVGNLNQFAFAQIGSGNSISGMVGNAGASDGNQAAVLQNGSNNVTSFTQNGSGSNNLSVSQ